MGTPSVRPQSARQIDMPGPVGRVQSRFVLGGQLACVSGRNILFSASQGAIYVLNDTAAGIWRALAAGEPPDAIAPQIAGHGNGSRAADACVDAALEEWMRLGLIRPLPSSAIGIPSEYIQTVSLAGVDVRIVYPATRAFPAAAVYRHLETRREAVDVVLQLEEHGGRLHLLRNEEWILSCLPKELPSALKGQLLAEVLEHAVYELVLHAAALLCGNRLVVLCGKPGAGKTTLSLALVHAGLGLAGDDVMLLNGEGRGIGLPFAPAVKSGAWPILAEYCPELAASPVFRRPDRKRVRYPVPEAIAPSSPRAVGWVILLDRDRNAPTRLEPVDPVDALRVLLEGAFAPGQALTGPAFEVLTETLRSAQLYRLTYSNLHEAVQVVVKTCR